eukprot:3242153-Pyramimonas_sp.AAC.1
MDVAWLVSELGQAGRITAGAPDADERWKRAALRALKEHEAAFQLLQTERWKRGARFVFTGPPAPMTAR